MKFIGDPKCRIEDVIDTLELAELPSGVEELGISEGGAFSNWKRPSVLWIGTERNQRLEELVKQLETLMKMKLDISPEKRDFRSHITIARVRGKITVGPVRKIIEQAVRDLKDREYFIPFDSIKLYSSTLTPTGPLYEVLRSFPFPE
jgi:2'-5' RNA ligase